VNDQRWINVTLKLCAPFRAASVGTIRKLFAISLILCTTSSCSSSTAAPHTAEEYKAAPVVTSNAEAYQETYTGKDDWILSSDGEVQFKDGSSETNNIQLHYDGQVADQEGYCVFELDDLRDVFQNKFDTAKIIRRCDGKTLDDFVLADIKVSIIGHPITVGGMSIFRIDAVYGPKTLNYYSGHSPSPSPNDENND